MTGYIELAYDRIVRETRLAILFDMGEKQPVWIPKTQIDMDDFDASSKQYKEVPVKEWWAERNGLV